MVQMVLAGLPVQFYPCEAVPGLAQLKIVDEHLRTGVRPTACHRPTLRVGQLRCSMVCAGVVTRAQSRTWPDTSAVQRFCEVTFG